MSLRDQSEQLSVNHRRSFRLFTNIRAKRNFGGRYLLNSEQHELQASASSLLYTTPVTDDDCRYMATHAILSFTVFCARIQRDSTDAVKCSKHKLINQTLDTVCIFSPLPNIASRKMVAPLQPMSGTTVETKSGDCIEVPAEFVCPIGLAIMEQPLMSRAGQTFDRINILKWLTTRENCPLTRQPLKASDLVRNRKLEHGIKIWKINNGVYTAASDEDDAPHPDLLKSDSAFGPVLCLGISDQKLRQVLMRNNDETMTLSNLARDMASPRLPMGRAISSPSSSPASADASSSRRHRWRLLSRLLDSATQDENEN